MTKNIFLEIIIFMLILLFVYTAISKLSNYSDFKVILNQTSELRPFAPILVVAIPLVELIAGFLLLSPSLRKIGLYFSFFLMMSFTLYIVYLTFIASERPCACGGVIKGLTWRQHLIFNLFFTFLTIVGIWLQKNLKLLNKKEYAIKLT